MGFNLNEENFIHNGWSFKSISFWLGLFFFALLILFISKGMDGYESLHRKKDRDPFLKVTNREFSIFLWQFPEFLRVNVLSKNGYLPGFLTTSANFNPDEGEELVSAPPDLLFLYHTWKRLLEVEWTPRPISPKEFEDFLRELPEWHPQNWPHAPEEYGKLIYSKHYTNLNDLQTLSDVSLPFIVRQAFQGWKNYFLEGKKINQIEPTIAQVRTFLEHHPNYARHFWRNIDTIHGKKIVGLDYLQALEDSFPSNAPFHKEQLTSFLRVALFNFDSRDK